MAGTVSDQYQTPKIMHLYQNFMVDSLRWNFIAFRHDDIVIATSGKTGTTWTQGIVPDLPGARPARESSRDVAVARDACCPPGTGADPTRAVNPSTLH